MQTLKQEYRKFMIDNFNGLQLKKPLFYRWNYGIRFNLQVGDTNTDEYFKEVTRRASTIFKTAFSNSDQLIFVLMDYKYKRRKIRFLNYSFKQINRLEKANIYYTKEVRFYKPNDKLNIRNIALIKLRTEQINYKNILTAIGHSDFEPRQPRLDNHGVFTSKEIYFVNLDKKLIFHMYDDRGLDIITADKETLRPIYKVHNNWILDYDRKQIDEQFE